MRIHSFIATLAVAFLGIAGAQADFKVVVNSSNSVESLAKDRVSDIFLKKLTRWDSGRPITPVDQAERNAVREQFTKLALKKEVAWVASYWQKMIFSGRATPPATLTSDSEVLDFVRTNPDAIGYVADNVSLPSGVKAVPVKE